MLFYIVVHLTLGDGVIMSIQTNACLSEHLQKTDLPKIQTKKPKNQNTIPCLKGATTFMNQIQHKWNVIDLCYICKLQGSMH